MQTDTKLVSHVQTWKIEEIIYLVKGVQYSLAEKYRDYSRILEKNLIII